VKKTLRSLAILFLVLVLIVVVFAFRKYKAGQYGIWFGSYLSQKFSDAPDVHLRQGQLHIMFLLVDHFEPGGDYQYLAHWIENYRKVVVRHHDSYGNHPKRTLHYPIEQFDSTEIELILPLCHDGLAEIELQLHHFNDDSASVTGKYKAGLAAFSHFGICQTIDDPPLTRFSLVHGNWALDNSAPDIVPNPCGVNNEIIILASLGCYLDVTFPAILTSSQPSRINSIYYATDDPNAPKSYDDGVPVEVGNPPTGDLMLLQGPLMVDWDDWRFKTHPSIENGDIFKEYPLFEKRIPLWLEANVHVIGQPNWVFIKLHSHGCRKSDSLALWGPSFDSTLTTLEGICGVGEDYVLHYVTVREAYNIIKAAEAGEIGNPERFRDYVIKPYRANQPL